MVMHIQEEPLGPRNEYAQGVADRVAENQAKLAGDHPAANKGKKCRNDQENIPKVLCPCGRGPDACCAYSKCVHQLDALCHRRGPACLMPPATSLLPHAGCVVPWAGSSLPCASCHMPSAQGGGPACLMPPATSLLPHAGCVVLWAGSSLPCASCHMPSAQGGGPACLKPPAWALAVDLSVGCSISASSSGSV